MCKFSFMILLFIFIFILPSVVKCQDVERLLEEAMQKYEKEDWNGVLEIARPGIKDAKMANNKNMTALLYLLIGGAYINLDKPITGIKYMESSRKLAIEIGDQDLQKRAATAISLAKLLPVEENPLENNEDFEDTVREVEKEMMTLDDIVYAKTVEEHNEDAIFSDIQRRGANIGNLSRNDAYKRLKNEGFSVEFIQKFKKFLESDHNQVIVTKPVYYKWNGTYRYNDTDRHVVVNFRLYLNIENSNIRGYILEDYSGFGPKNSKELRSVISGRYDAKTNTLRFTKTYDYDKHSVTYNGSFNPSGTKISGRWNIKDYSGSWEATLVTK